MTILQKSKLQLRDMLAMPEEARVKLTTEYFAGGMTSQLRVIMAGELLHIPAVEYPANWFEALKERFMPFWMRIRWPIRYRYVTWESTVLYPRVSLPHEEWHFAKVKVKFEEHTR